MLIHDSDRVYSVTLLPYTFNHTIFQWPRNRSAHTPTVNSVTAKALDLLLFYNDTTELNLKFQCFLEHGLTGRNVDHSLPLYPHVQKL